LLTNFFDLKNILILILVFSSQVSFSQSYAELPDSNAKWINTHRTFTGIPGNDPEWQIQYCAFGNDTVLNAKTYFKIDTCGGGYKGALRNDNGKVHFIPKDSTAEFLLYDFTLNEGDTIKDVYVESPNGYPNLYNLYIDSGAVDSVLLDGVYRKRIAFEFGLGWIEGIGNSQGLFWEPWGNLSAYALELYCLSVGGITVYPDAGFGACESFITIDEEVEAIHELDVFPNPTKTDFTVKLNSPFQELCVIDAKGIEIISALNLSNNSHTIQLAPFPNGIYLIIVKAKNKILTKKIIKE